MAGALHRAAGVAEQEEWHTLVTVNVRIAQRAAVKNQRVIQQIAVAVGCVLQFVGEVGDEAVMVRVVKFVNF